ncbi:hypothetical protein RvY_12985 [Ramazzottius varieornatus]|uniref:Uncharacterized protein n=1 Tax=Ramazzottius varieornatus TaxID=947166 RepID=A0A1D1VLB6_RAMVA|nr:hypothetical protein RvY_12985 [Ramazzottius varieornatus]
MRESHAFKGEMGTSGRGNCEPRCEVEKTFVEDNRHPCWPTRRSIEHSQVRLMTKVSKVKPTQHHRVDVIVLLQDFLKLIFSKPQHAEHSIRRNRLARVVFRQSGT